MNPSPDRVDGGLLLLGALFWVAFGVAAVVQGEALVAAICGFVVAGCAGMWAVRRVMDRFLGDPRWHDDEGESA